MTNGMRRGPARVAGAVLVALAVAVTTWAIVPSDSGQASAQGRLRAKVYLTQARIPRSLSERGLIGFARRHNAKRLRETTAEKLEDREWKAEMILSFNRAPGDLEFHVLYYDIEDGARRFVEDMSTFVSDRSQKTFVQRIKLERPRFKPNRRMELVVTVRRNEVGRHKFELIGEAKRHSGTVDFTNDGS